MRDSIIDKMRELSKTKLHPSFAQWLEASIADMVTVALVAKWDITYWGYRYFLQSTSYPKMVECEELLEAIEGHVIGRGDLVPIYERF